MNTPEGAVDEDLSAVSAPTSAPITFEMFARTLRPQSVTVPNLSRPGASRQEIVPGAPDEVYLRLVRIRHGFEKRSPESWQSLIDDMRGEPAHPSALGA